MNILNFFKLKGRDFEVTESPAKPDAPDIEKVQSRKDRRCACRLDRIKQSMDMLRGKGLESSPAFTELSMEYLRLNGGNV